MFCPKLRSPVPRRSPAPVRAVLTLPLVLAVLMGCGETTTEPGPDPLTFQGTVEPAEGYADFTGNVWINTTTQQMAVTVAFAGGPEADGYEWMIRQGDCNAPGDVIGSATDYPTIVPDGEGAWDAVLEIGFRDEPSVAMEVEFIPAGGGSPTFLGCATLEPQPET